MVSTGSEAPGGGKGDTGPDDVDAEARELLGDLELLRRVQRDAGRLLAIAQRRVEDDYSVVLCGHVGRVSCRLKSRLLLNGLAASRPPRTIPPEGGGGEVDARARTTCAP